MSLARRLANGLMHLVYPGICPVCDRAIDIEEKLPCASCRAALVADAHEACPRCGSTVGPFANVEGGCVICREVTLHFERVIRMGPYEGLLRDVILRMKHAQGEVLAELVGQLWFDKIGPTLKQFAIDQVVPVPLHWWRYWRRGYNQSAVLARVLARGLGVPLKKRCLRRVRATPSQTEQTPAGRWQNMRGAFWARASSDLRGKTILLVDDVLTTGSTCSEAARALRQAGATRVIVAVVAKSRD
jgi:ComF family protein